MRVLLVEDARRPARLTEQRLDALGFSVDVEHNGLSGFHRALDVDYDVVILDLLLPGMNGFTICRKLRAEAMWAPILVLTAKDGEWDETEALDAGADDYLREPFSLHVLAARLRALVRRGPGRPRPVLLRCGSLALDPAGRTATRREHPVDLTRREYDLLEALLRAEGHPVPKEELLDRVWGDDAVNPNVVAVYVRYLRQKIDRPFGLQTLLTVHGVGYRLRAAP